MVWPLFLHVALAIAIAVGMLLTSHLLGERHATAATAAPYESGMRPTGVQRQRFPAHFYLVAVFFVIFDLEVAYLFAWGVAATRLGWPGFWEAAVFVSVLFAALVYLWRIGALEWGSPTQLRHASELRVHAQGISGPTRDHSHPTRARASQT